MNISFLVFFYFSFTTGQGSGSFGCPRTSASMWYS